MYLLCCAANPSKPRNPPTDHCGALSSSGIAPSPSTDNENRKRWLAPFEEKCQPPFTIGPYSGAQLVAELARRRKKVPATFRRKVPATLIDRPRSTTTERTYNTRNKRSSHRCFP